MRNRVLLSSLVLIGSIFAMGAVTASADQILIGGSTGALTVTCTINTSCTFTLPGGGVGSTNTAAFESPTGNLVTGGSYSFTGGPTTITTINGLNFTVSSGNGWGFTFDDKSGDVLSGTANWVSFNDASKGGFSEGVLQLDVNSTSCSNFTAICTDFANGGTITNLYFDMSPNLALLYSTGGSTSARISSGEIFPNAPVPEPGTLALFGSGLIGLAGYARRRFGKS